MSVYPARAPRWALTTLATAAAWLVAACGGASPGEPDPGPVALVVVTPASDTLPSAGSSRPLVAEARDAAGATLAGKTFTWSSSDVTIARVAANGRVTATGPNGVVTISAATDGVSGTALIAVVMSAVGGVVTSVGGRVTLTVPAGALAQPTSVAINATTGVPVSPLLLTGTSFEFLPAGLQFSTPAQLAITYGPTDLPPGVREGELRLQRVTGGSWLEVAGSTVNQGANVVAGSISGFSVYGIVAASIASIDVLPETLVLSVGESAQATATPRDEGNGVLADRTLVWSSGDEGVATVGQDGVVTGVGAGTAAVFASGEGVTGSATVMVAPANEPPMAVIAAPGQDTTVTLGDALGFAGTASDADGTVVTHAWAFGDGTGAAVEDPGPHVYPAVGTYGVTYQVTDDDGAVSALAARTVTVSSGVRVALTPPTGRLGITECVDFTAAALDSDGLPIADPPFAWAVRDPLVAGRYFQVSNLSRSAIAGLAEGVTFVVVGLPGAADSSEITVDAGRFAELTATRDTVAVGDTTRVTARLWDGGAEVSEAAFVWVFVNSAIARTVGTSPSSMDLEARGPGSVTAAADLSPRCLSGLIANLRTSTEVAVVAPSTVAGRVVRENDGVGLAAVNVLLIHGDDTTTVVTDADGSYAFTRAVVGMNIVAVDPASLPPFGAFATPAQREVAIGQPGDVVTGVDFGYRVATVELAAAAAPGAVSVGEEIEVTLSLALPDVSQPVAGVSGWVSWQAGLATFVAGSEDGSGWSGGFVVNEPDAGTLRFAAVDADGIAGGMVTVMTFRVQATSAGQISFTPLLGELEVVDPATGETTSLHLSALVTYTSAAATVQ